jgi:hypothetical protein
MNTECKLFCALINIWGLLADHVSPAKLHRVRVWETPKTCADYAGP